MNMAINSATIQERLDALDREQARRSHEIAAHHDARAELDRQRAVLDIEQQLDGHDRGSALKELLKRRAGMQERLDALQGELERGRMEREVLAERHAEATRAELERERAQLAAEYTTLAERAAVLLAELAAVQRRGWLLRGEDEQLREHPALVGPKGRPAPRGAVYDDLGPPVPAAIAARAAGRAGEAAA